MDIDKIIAQKLAMKKLGIEEEPKKEPRSEIDEIIARKLAAKKLGLDESVGKAKGFEAARELMRLRDSLKYGISLRGEDEEDDEYIEALMYINNDLKDDLEKMREQLEPYKQETVMYEEVLNLIDKVDKGNDPEEILDAMYKVASDRGVMNESIKIKIEEPLTESTSNGRYQLEVGDNPRDLQTVATNDQLSKIITLAINHEDAYPTVLVWDSEVSDYVDYNDLEESADLANDLAEYIISLAKDAGVKHKSLGRGRLNRFELVKLLSKDLQDAKNDNVDVDIDFNEVYSFYRDAYEGWKGTPRPDLDHGFLDTLEEEKKNKKTYNKIAQIRMVPINGEKEDKEDSLITIYKQEGGGYFVYNPEKGEALGPISAEVVEDYLNRQGDEFKEKREYVEMNFKDMIDVTMPQAFFGMLESKSEENKKYQSATDMGYSKDIYNIDGDKIWGYLGVDNFDNVDIEKLKEALKVAKKENAMFKCTDRFWEQYDKQVDKGYIKVFFENEVLVVYKWLDMSKEELIESRKLNEGPGAGYHFEGTLYIDNLKEFDMEEIDTDLYKVSIPATFSGTVNKYDISREVDEEVIITKLHINELSLETSSTDATEYMISLEDEIYQELRTRRAIKINSDMIGAGYIHQTFDGEVISDVETDIGPAVWRLCFEFNKYDTEHINNLLRESDYDEEDLNESINNKVNKSLNEASPMSNYDLVYDKLDDIGYKVFSLDAGKGIYITQKNKRNLSPAIQFLKDNDISFIEKESRGRHFLEIPLVNTLSEELDREEQFEKEVEKAEKEYEEIKDKLEEELDEIDPKIEVGMTSVLECLTELVNEMINDSLEVEFLVTSSGKTVPLTSISKSDNDKLITMLEDERFTEALEAEGVLETDWTTWARIYVFKEILDDEEDSRFNTIMRTLVNKLNGIEDEDKATARDDGF